MDEIIKDIFSTIGISFALLEDNQEILIERELLICETKYLEVKDKIPNLKKYFSSSFLTSLQKKAAENQKWPLLNLVRQILKARLYEMKPIRKANGYTKQGVKLYKRFFLISKLEKKIDTKSIQTNNES
jgi:hypothetical protein